VTLINPDKVNYLYFNHATSNYLIVSFEQALDDLPTITDSELVGLVVAIKHKRSPTPVGSFKESTGHSIYDSCAEFNCDGHSQHPQFQWDTVKNEWYSISPAMDHFIRTKKERCKEYDCIYHKASLYFSWSDNNEWYES
jgi:hypothetical protein